MGVDWPSPFGRDTRLAHIELHREAASDASGGRGERRGAQVVRAIDPAATHMEKALNTIRPYVECLAARSDKRGDTPEAGKDPCTRAD